ncbi:MAG: NGG1p interacting factor NIF3 [Planctomycetota bacterium]|nr:NGG1p interacting factor NIF3 [Planctomycetota bacterium]
MKLKEFHTKAVQVGMKYDPRGEEGVKKELEKLKSEYEGLSEREKQWFNTDRLENPYTDTNILNGSGDEELGKLAVGIDCDNSELLLVNELNKNGANISGVLAHHPGGKMMEFHHVMGVQVDMFTEWGIPVNQVEPMMKERAEEVSRAVLPTNTRRTMRTAQLLGIPYLCVHSPADNSVQQHVQATCDEHEPEYIKNLIELLTDEYPEYRRARSMQEAMKVFVGNKNNHCGKIVVKMTGGTQGPTAQFEKLAQAGVGTMICMHLRDDARKEAKKHNINVLIAGHMASDSIGMNLMLSRVDPDGEIEILPLSGLLYEDRR